MTASDARAALTRCCGCRRWVAEMMDARPYRDDAGMSAAAERIWWSLGPADWREAFAVHPRIGERGQDAWSRDEQAGVHRAAEQTQRALADANRSYEQHFGLATRDRMLRPSASDYGRIARANALDGRGLSATSSCVS